MYVGIGVWSARCLSGRYHRAPAVASPAAPRRRDRDRGRRRPIRGRLRRMGFLTTRWEATYEGHNITVSRNEVLRGFTLEWDGRELARRTWSWIGLGELHGSADVDGKHHEVHVKLSI